MFIAIKGTDLWTHGRPGSAGKICTLKMLTGMIETTAGKDCLMEKTFG